MLSSADEMQAVEAGSREADLGASFQVAGDWHSYVIRSQNQASADDQNSRLAKRRKCALAYLGKRSQLAGGVYNSRSPSIFTNAAIEELREANRHRRQARYPWLANLLAITEALERDQQTKENVRGSILSFPSRIIP